MNCKICNKELTLENESESNGICKKCKLEELTKIKEQASCYNEITSKKQHIQCKKNRIAKTILIMNNIIFAIPTTISIIVILSNIVNLIQSTLQPKFTFINFLPIVFSIIQIGVSLIFYILLKGFAEIIVLLDKINQKIE